MSKFNLRKTARPGVSPVLTAERPTGWIFEGAPGYARDPKSELFLLAVTSTVGEDTFYEAADARDARLRDLVARVAVEDFEWTLGLVGWLRTGALLRSVATVAAVEAVRARLAAGEVGGNRALVRAALARADEPGELLAYWTSRYGRRLPQPVKRGVADAAVNLYSERSLVKYDSAARGFRFADVLELTHPSPRDARQAALFRYALDRRHDRAVDVPAELPVLAARELLLALPVDERRAVLTGSLGVPGDVLAQAGMTWESLAGWLQGPLDAVAWEAALPAMGYMARLRNLRNLDEAGVSDQVASQVAARLADPDEVARSRQLPLRFLSAYRAAPSLRWAWALEQALQSSLANVPALPGRTLVLVDRSGSMFTPLARRSQVTRADAAAVFGTALALRAQAADLVEFGSRSRTVRVPRGASVLTVAERFGNLGGTDTADAVRRHFAGHDRVVLVTDEQAWGGWGGEDPTRFVPEAVPVYTFNLAGYRYGHGPSGVGNRHTFGGLTDQAFAAIPLLESGRDSTWPYCATPRWGALCAPPHQPRVAQRRGQRLTKPSGAGSSPATGTARSKTVLAQLVEAPPSEGGGSGFDSPGRYEPLNGGSVACPPKAGRSVRLRVGGPRHGCPRRRPPPAEFVLSRGRGATRRRRPGAPPRLLGRPSSLPRTS